MDMFKNVVLIGETRSGKTSFCNYFVNLNTKSTIPVHASFQSQTKQINKTIIEKQEGVPIEIHVYDLPGMNDTNKNDNIINIVRVFELLKSINTVDLLLLFISKSRPLNEASIAALNDYFNIFKSYMYTDKFRIYLTDITDTDYQENNENGIVRIIDDIKQFFKDKYSINNPYVQIIDLRPSQKERANLVGELKNNDNKECRSTIFSHSLRERSKLYYYIFNSNCSINTSFEYPLIDELRVMKESLNEVSKNNLTTNLKIIETFELKIAETLRIQHDLTSQITTINGKIKEIIDENQKLSQNILSSEKAIQYGDDFFTLTKKTKHEIPILINNHPYKEVIGVKDHCQIKFKAKNSVMIVKIKPNFIIGSKNKKMNDRTFSWYGSAWLEWEGKIVKYYCENIRIKDKYDIEYLKNKLRDTTFITYKPDKFVNWETYYNLILTKNEKEDDDF